MKDAYSFHLTDESLDETYEKMHTAYTNIFNRLGLNFRSVLADTGSIGGAKTHEFQVLAYSGEDDIVFSNVSDYAANIELAEAVAPSGERPTASQELNKVSTPNCSTIEDVAKLLNVDLKQVLKAIVVNGEDEEGKATAPVVLFLRGDHELNEIKAEKLPGVASPLQFASIDDVVAIGGVAGFVGPQGLTAKCYVDRSAAHMADFVCGANEIDTHLTGFNWQRDAELGEVQDLRNVQVGDPSPCGQGTLELKRGIEVGHIFQLGTKYSAAMKATVLDENGKAQTMTMGCYGIGVSRVVAAAIEQNHDDKGIIWPDALAPFQVGIVPMGYGKSEAVTKATDELYAELTAAGLDVFLDDRDKRTSPGVKFADMELIGIPYRVVLSDRLLEAGNVEFAARRDGVKHEIEAANITELLRKTLAS